jgi:hypothetical protein
MLLYIYIFFFLLPCVSSAVYVEGDIETRVYNDSVNDQVKNIPEICVRRDGMLIHTSFFPIMFIIETVFHISSFHR